MLEHVHDGVGDGEIVGRGDVPGPDHGDVEQDREGGVGEQAGAALEVVNRAGHRSQDHLRQPEDREDRHDVEQQDVLGHVHEEEIVGERIDRRDQRREPAQERADEAAQPPHGRLLRPPRRSPVADLQPAAQIDASDQGGADQHAGAERPGEVGVHLLRLSHSGLQHCVEGPFTSAAERRSIGSRRLNRTGRPKGAYGADRHQGSKRPGHR